VITEMTPTVVQRLPETAKAPVRVSSVIAFGWECARIRGAVQSRLWITEMPRTGS
jgi:hypothetical protein